MYIDRKVTPYPYHGTFFTVAIDTPDDGDILGGGTVETEKVLLETVCDIQQASKRMVDGTIISEYDVYFPLESGSVSPVNLGDMFRCPKESYGININGRVVGLEVSMLGGVTANIKMSEV